MVPARYTEAMREVKDSSVKRNHRFCGGNFQSINFSVAFL